MNDVTQACNLLDKDDRADVGKQRGSIINTRHINYFSVLVSFTKELMITRALDLAIDSSLLGTCFYAVK